MYLKQRIFSNMQSKKTNDYSRLQAAFANELHVDGGVVKTKPTTPTTFQNIQQKHFPFIAESKLLHCFRF